MKRTVDVKKPYGFEKQGDLLILENGIQGRFKIANTSITMIDNCDVPNEYQSPKEPTLVLYGNITNCMYSLQDTISLQPSNFGYETTAQLQEAIRAEINS